MGNNQAPSMLAPNPTPKARVPKTKNEVASKFATSILSSNTPNEYREMASSQAAALEEFWLPYMVRNSKTTKATRKNVGSTTTATPNSWQQLA
eukprot:CAMPEP_0204048870 /NCGR_PEP_ID=MMETSP0360-20130528/116893_1 /ASSEMBLY_ACC=CAM_ASM_000342 /TAXON_ID=268821 /ORGANISM="Scrippsiella Hangoei, Strain SHTV-5" /LENGTH=92 /DNA_ID=CAMNT_0050995717 /DNA_START=76 /DNA_END=351 /DNA_ORIENTATION=+